MTSEEERLRMMGADQTAILPRISAHMPPELQDKINDLHQKGLITEVRPFEAQRSGEFPIVPTTLPEEEEVLIPDGYLTVVYMDNSSTDFDFEKMGPQGWHWNDEGNLIVSYDVDEMAGRTEIPRTSIRRIVVTNNSAEYMKQKEAEHLLAHTRECERHLIRAIAKYERETGATWSPAFPSE